MDILSARFFKGSPVLEVLDFLERLAPFTEPEMVLKDTRPMMTAELAHQEVVVTEKPNKDATESTGESEGFNALQALRNSLAQ